MAATISQPQIAVLIPALNEEESVGGVIASIRAVGLPGLAQIIVADNGSTDATGAVARQAGALVVSEPRRGYGAACLAAMAAMNEGVEIVVFMDADGSDVAAEASELVAPILANEADLVIGSRALGRVDPGAMSLPQRFGNWLSAWLMRVIWGAHFTDLGPFRAIRRDALDGLCMADRDFGWTVEMQVKAARVGLRCTERPADYRRRAGKSKISGTVTGVVKAGSKILYVIGREALFGAGKRRSTVLRR